MKSTRYGYAILVLILVGATILWLRNRDILSDLYDYSSMITAAGKIEAGLKPYTDFRSTMQSACYLLPQPVEWIFGRSYLGLTWGGLILSLGGALAVFALLRPSLGAITAALITGAVSWAGFAQHVIIFYNPVGLLCLAVVVFVLANPTRGGNLRDWRTWLLCVALLIGGANKINFQALTIGLGGLLTLRAGASGVIGWRRVLATWGALLGFGLFIPIGLELWWTGATPNEWYFNVVGLAEARVSYVSKIFTLKAYLAPTYTLHKHVLFESLHTVGLLALGLLTMMAWRQISRQKFSEAAHPHVLQAVLCLTALAMGVGGVLLTITNVEIITLTSLGVLVGAAALTMSHNIAHLKASRIVLGGVALIWITTGGFAAWKGARTLYARSDVDRTPFVRLENAPSELAYLEGVRLDADLRESLLLTAKEIQKIKAGNGNLSGVLFGPTLEWMERDTPESILRGMPVWYDLGTSLQQSDTSWLIDRFESKPIDRIFLHPDWESWPADFHIWLNQNFRTIPLGQVVKLYERRTKRNLARTAMTFADSSALAMLDHTGSQIHVRRTQGEAAQLLTFTSSPWGDYFGTSGNWTWAWDHPVRTVEGMFVATTATKLTTAVQIDYRILSLIDDNPIVLSTRTITLTPDQPDFRAPFRVEPNGTRLVFEIETSGDQSNSVTAGWREIRIPHVGDTQDEGVPPGLNITGTARRTILAADDFIWLRISGESQSAGENDPITVPFEAWKSAPVAGKRWQATVHVSPQTKADSTPPIVMLVWCKSTRLEIIHQEVLPIQTGSYSIEGRPPESGGWMGLIVRPLQRDKSLNTQFKIEGWQ